MELSQTGSSDNLGCIRAFLKNSLDMAPGLHLSAPVSLLVFLAPDLSAFVTAPIADLTAHYPIDAFLRLTVLDDNSFSWKIAVLA